MNDSDLTGVLVEKFLGRIRIGDVPDVDEFIAEHSAAGDAEDLRGLLLTLLDVERLTSQSPIGGDELPPPDLSSCGYRLLEKIGAGGMGVVYRALQVALGRHVAIKLLRPELLSDPEIRELFRVEAQILARFDHQGIVRIFGCEQCADTFFYVMELVEGRRLDALSGRPSRGQVLQWAIESADALACAHSHGIVHGDIKPANFLLDKSGHIRICDFGLALVSRNSRRDRGCHGGTPRYMAPEIEKGGTKSFAGDQYALCASLVEIAASVPFDRSRRLTFLGRRLAAIFAKGLEADPKGRYPSVADLRDDLLRIVRNEPIAAMHTPAVVRLGLMCLRHPIAAVSASLLLLCFVAVFHGLIRTERALGLAQRNAATANAAIGKVFDDMVEMPPAPENADLLTQLIPYYEQIAANPNIPQSELTGALTQLAQTAMRTGDYLLAERTLRKLLEYGESSDNLCRLADALSGQGKRDESERIYRRLIGHYSSGTPQERLDVARARLSLMKNGAGADATAHKQAVRGILAEHLAAAPDDDKALFLYAQFLGLDSLPSDSRIAGLPSDPIEILDGLTSRNPNNSRYWKALVEAAVDWLERADGVADCPPSVESALDKSDIMLWRFLRNPNTVSQVISLKRAYSRWLRMAGARPDPAHGQRSVDILTHALLNHPDLPMQDQSDVIAISLEGIEERLRHGFISVFRINRLCRSLDEIEGFLDTHPLPRKGEFLQRIREIEAITQGL